MKIWFRMHGFEPCSWTYVWQNLRIAFKDLGHEMFDLEPPPKPEECVELWWGDPQFWEWSRSKVKARIALALSEAHSILFRGRQRVITNLDKSDLIICPSESATLAFREAPIETPIEVVFFGVDTEIFPYIKRDFMREIVFLHAGVTQFRKGSWLVPEAFISVFGEQDKARLKIVSPKKTPMFVSLRDEYSRHPQIEFVDNLSDNPLDIYEKSHVYVSPHLSEGFGLMIPEAMATGMPCIVSRCSAPREFFSKDYGWWVEMSEDYLPVDQCLPETDGFWRVPEFSSLCDAMRKAYEDRLRCQEISKLASEYVHRNLTWEHTATQIIQKIEEVLDEKDFGNSSSI